LYKHEEPKKQVRSLKNKGGGSSVKGKPDQEKKTRKFTNLDKE